MTGSHGRDCAETSTWARSRLDVIDPMRQKPAISAQRVWEAPKLPSSRRTSPRFLLEPMATGRASRRRWIRRWTQFGDQPQNLGEQHPRHGDLGHLERNVASVANNL